jgi:threonine-phosphate decarboxylase
MDLIHGGDNEGYILERGAAPLDFSANCNPLGIPAGVVTAIAEAAAGADRYPDPLCRRLTSALSSKLGIPPDRLLFGNGAADLIFRLALAKKPRTALVTAPTFAEYELALETVGCNVVHHVLTPDKGFSLTDEILEDITPALDLLFVCNPNNPTGLTADPALLRRILEKCGQTGTLLVADECFNGFLDHPEIHTLRPRLEDCDNLLILDAFTKLYGMAGVRLGYCMSKNTALLESLRNAGQPWAVSSLAQAAGIAALAEDAYVARARELVKTERAYLLASLENLGINAVSGQANYIFFHSDIPSLVSRLRDSGILIRDCGNYHGLTPGYYRIAVRTHAENTRLIDAITRM